MLLGFATAGETGQWAASQFLGGPYTAVFFSCVVVLGLLVPLVMEAVEARRHLPFATMRPGPHPRRRPRPPLDPPDGGSALRLPLPPLR